MFFKHFFCTAVIFGIIASNISCNKNVAPVENFPETIFPSNYYFSHFRNSAPYIRLFTANGEITNGNYILDYLNRHNLSSQFSYIPIDKTISNFSFTAGIQFKSKDSIMVYGINPNTGIGIQSIMQSNGNNRLFKTEGTLYNAIFANQVYIKSQLRAFSMHKLPYEELTTNPINIYIPVYRFSPEFIAYKTAKDTLEVPSLNYHLWGGTAIFTSGLSGTIANELDITGTSSLTAANNDTMAIQQQYLVLTRQ